MTMRNTPKVDCPFCQVWDAHVFHYIVENGVTYLCMADEQSRRRIPFAFLEVSVDSMKVASKTNPVVAITRRGVQGKITRNIVTADDLILICFHRCLRDSGILGIGYQGEVHRAVRTQHPNRASFQHERRFRARTTAANGRVQLQPPRRFPAGD